MSRRLSASEALAVLLDSDNDSEIEEEVSETEDNVEHNSDYNESSSDEEEENTQVEREEMLMSKNGNIAWSQTPCASYIVQVIMDVIVPNLPLIKCKTNITCVRY